MSWRDELRKVTITIGGQQRQLVGASFRGVPFFVESIESTGGRRIVVHEFPFRDSPFVEDLGKKAGTFRIDGYVLGDDYLTQSEALRSALQDQAGPGELVHPYEGVKRAICAGLSTRHTKNDGGIGFFSIELAETPAQAPVPVAVADDTAQVATAADAAVLASKAELEEQFDASGLPSFAIASAEDALARAAAALSEKLAPLINESQELAEFTGRIAVLTAEASSLVRQPADAFDGFRGAVIGLVTTAASAPGAVLDALVEAYAAELGATVAPTTSTRERELTNQNALTAALRRIIAIEAARLAPFAPYASIEEAIEARDQIKALLDDQAALAGDTAYPAIVDLRSELLHAVPGSTAFASIVIVERKVSIPSLLLAYQLYGSVDQEADIIARNAIDHPGFVGGTLKVLSDG